MKEPWKKACNGKVVITLNDEKTPPTEVEVPVDLSWTNRCERKSSTNKTIVLVAVLLVLGLTIVTLFKVQNLVYSTSYMNWRMQELESSVNEANDDVKLIKYKLSLDEREEARAEALIGSIGNSKGSLESQDLKLSESQNQNRKLSNSLNSEPEVKSTKEAEVQNSKSIEPEKAKESMDNDARNHPNPTDSEELLEPLVEILKDIGNNQFPKQRNENNFFKNVLDMLSPSKPDDQKIILKSIVRIQEKPMDSPQEPFSFLKKMLPDTNIKIIHFNERPMEQQLPQQQQPSSSEEEIAHRFGFPSVKIMSPFDDMNKQLIPIKFFPQNDKQEPPMNEMRPRIIIKSFVEKKIPIPLRDDFNGGRKDLPMPMNQNDNFEVYKMNPESSEPSQEVEAPKMPMPFPFPFNPFHIEDIIRSIPLVANSIKIIPGRKEEPAQPQNDDINQAEKILPEIHDLIMKMTPPMDQNPSAENSYSQMNSNESQDQSNPEISKAAIRVVPIPPALMESFIPVNNFSEPTAHIAESPEDVPQQEQQLPHQQQPSQESWSQESMSRPITKLNPVPSSWDVPPTQEPPVAQN